MRSRLGFIVLLVVLCLSAIMVRLVYLNVQEGDFLKARAKQAAIRVRTIRPVRGLIVDREGEPLAISSPVYDIWINPSTFKATKQWPHVLKVLNIDVSYFNQRLESYHTKHFMFVKRQVTPMIAHQLKMLKVKALHFDKTYRRYYPLGAAAAQVVGFTNVDGKGQEGIELAYNKWLSGRAGKLKVEQDLKGNAVEKKILIAPTPGHPLALSLDNRIQIAAYNALKKTVVKAQAQGGSAVMLDVKTGEVIAMANYPSFNPNNLSSIIPGSTRNRAVTDVFEPGSSMKTFSVLTALESGLFDESSQLVTSPGYIMIGKNKVKDPIDYGTLTPGGVLQRSSNVGTSKLILGLEDLSILPRNLRRFGFGQTTGSGFPGEQSGHVPYYRQAQRFQHATLSFGYGMTATPLQLAHAYTIIADHGVSHPVTLLRLNHSVKGERVMSASLANRMLALLNTVVSWQGTGYKADIPGYQVGGKTGTAIKVIKGRYASHRYVAVFVGVIPISRPRLVLAIVIDDPKGDAYSGGGLAAPLFKKVMTAAVRILQIAPDRMPSQPK